jgi:hypothetical protein
MFQALQPGAFYTGCFQALSTCTARVTRHDPTSIWEIDMGYRYGRLHINEISIGISIRDMAYRYGIWYIDMVIYDIDMVILDINVE